MGKQYDALDPHNFNPFLQTIKVLLELNRFTGKSIHLLARYLSGVLFAVY